MSTIGLPHIFVKKIMTTQSHFHIKNRIIHSIVAVLLFCNVALAQDTLKSTNESFPLEELKDYTQTFYYSQGHEERANRIAMFIEDAGAYFQKEIGFTPKTTLYILAPKHWKEFAAKPFREVYGFPHNATSGQLVIAAEDNDFWRSFLQPVNSLVPSIAADVTKAYGKPDGSFSMMPFFDLLALHEMGHSYTAQAGLNMHNYSMGELFVNIMLHTYVVEKQPELLSALETFPNMVIGMGSEEFKFTSLEDFEELYPTLGMGPKNYGWYQCMLHSAAKDIYNSGGKMVLKKLWNALKKHQEEMTDEQFIRMLQKEVHPSVANVYLNWNKTE